MKLGDAARARESVDATAALGCNRGTHHWKRSRNVQPRNVRYPRAAFGAQPQACSVARLAWVMASSKSLLRDALSATTVKDKGPPVSDGILSITPDTPEVVEWRRSALDITETTSTYLDDEDEGMQCSWSMRIRGTVGERLCAHVGASWPCDAEAMHYHPCDSGPPAKRALRQVHMEDRELRRNRQA